MDQSVEKTQFSDCGRYRYTLRRSTLWGSKRVCFVMLNPSVADALLDDPTTRRAVDFAQRLFDCREYLAVNLFALRSTNPKGLKLVDDPIGPENDKYLLAAAQWADEIVVAWGNGGAFKARDKSAMKILGNRRIWCLGRTKPGHPNFPLYLPANTRLEVFRDTKEMQWTI